MRERGLRRAHRHLRSEFARRGDTALVDAGALNDPIVRCIDLAREIFVGEDLARQIAAAAKDNRAQDCHEAAPPIAWRGGLAWRASAVLILAKSSSRTT